MAIIFIRWIDRQHRIETISYQVILAWLKERVVFHSCVIWVHSLLLVQENRGKNSQKWRIFLKRRSVSLSKIVSHLVADPGGYTPGGKLQQHVAATRCSDKSLRVYWRNLWKSLSLQQNFVAATSRTDSVWFDFLRLVAATKFCSGDKDFYKNSPVHTKRFVAATGRLTLLLQLVARPVHMEWYVAATSCCNLSPSVYRPLDRTEAWRAE